MTLCLMICGQPHVAKLVLRALKRHGIQAESRPNTAKPEIVMIYVERGQSVRALNLAHEVMMERIERIA